MAKKKRPKKSRSANAAAGGAVAAAGGNLAIGEKTYTMEATSYGPPWDAMNGTGVTSQGVDLTDAPCDVYVVAVDPSVIPYKSLVRVWPNPHGQKDRLYVAADTGGAIVGKRIDIYHCDRAKQLAFGRKRAKVVVYPPGSTPGDWDISDHPSGSADIPSPGDLLKGIDLLAETIRKFFDTLFSSSFWLTVGKAVLGGIALLLGISLLGRSMLGVDLGVGERVARGTRTRRQERHRVAEMDAADARAAQREYDKQAAREKAKSKGREERRQAILDTNTPFD